MQVPASYDTLVAQIYNAGAGRIPWEAVLHAVNAALQTWAITFTAADKHTGGILYSHLGNLRLQSSLGQKIMDALPQPVVLVDAVGRMHYANAAGHQALANRRYIFDRAGQLACRRAEDETALHMALASLALNTPGIVGKERAFVRLSVDGTSGHPTPIGVCLSPLRPAEVMGAFGAVPMALLMFYDSAQVASQTPEFLAEVFNLSPAEAQVAVQLTQGLTLKEIAQERKVSLTTVQSQLKSLKEKTATTRQPDLVRKLVAMTVLFD